MKDRIVRALKYAFNVSKEAVAGGKRGAKANRGNMKEISRYVSSPVVCIVETPCSIINTVMGLWQGAKYGIETLAKAQSK